MRDLQAPTARAEPHPARAQAAGARTPLCDRRSALALHVDDPRRLHRPHAECLGHGRALRVAAEVPARQRDVAEPARARHVATCCPARIVRSEVASVTGVGVTYQTAAQFSETLELLKKIAPPAEVVPTVARAVTDAAAALAGGSARSHHDRVCISISATTRPRARLRGRAPAAWFPTATSCCATGSSSRRRRRLDLLRGAWRIRRDGAGDVRARPSADRRGIQAAQGGGGDGGCYRSRRDTLADHSPFRLIRRPNFS